MILSHEYWNYSECIAYDDYDDFQHVNFIFSQKFISLFWGLFNDKTDPRVTCSEHIVENKDFRHFQYSIELFSCLDLIW
jgi:hypothetical protein